MKKKKILVGLSGGVDSAVAAHLLIEQGHKVIAGFMKNYAEESNPNCHTKEDRDMAIKVAQHLGIDTFVILDFRKQYQEKIIEYIYNNYQKGVTPNPDVLCNSLIKFALFLEKAHELGCDLVATGHYARIEKTEQKTHLLRGTDKNKDQSYFLSQLNQKQLANSIFPIGHLTKDEVRNIARTRGLPNAERPDSQGLCFIGNIPIKKFLEKKIKAKPGDVIDEHGNIVGSHDGAYFYTLGQRHGFQTPFKAYITKIDIQKNQIAVTQDKESKLLYTDTILCNKRHRIVDTPTLPYSIDIKIRYRQKETIKATIKKQKNQWHIQLKEKVRGVAPGQFAVAYSKDTVLGSGIISERLQDNAKQVY